MSESPILYKRSENIVSYWADGHLVFHNFATGVSVAGTALTIGLLDYFHTWQSADALLARSSASTAALQRALKTLVRSSLLQQSDRPSHPAERALEKWKAWNPAAGFFHFSTKNLPFEVSEVAQDAFLRHRAATKPVPPSTKSYSSCPMVTLPDLSAQDTRTSLSRALLARRTWRRFGHEPLSLRQLSVLMRLTFGAQKFIDLGAAGAAMLRTSPSAGARNPIEAYLVVRSVSDLAPGIYHYAPIEHRLARLKKGPQRSTIQKHLPGQSWYANASALVLMTAVFERTDWKYPFARAYRTVLLEAGHFCQTFCLIATALGLAPFCTAALADSTIERDLGLDGVGESVIYACGVGTRPVGVDWAPTHKRTEAPHLIASPAVPRG